jgi:hypothetical protein
MPAALTVGGHLPLIPPDLPEDTKMKLEPATRSHKKSGGFGLVECIVALTLLTGLAYALLKENVSLIREKQWAVRLILARGQMSFYEAQARSADKSILSSTSLSANPWAYSPDQAVPIKITLGSWPETGVAINAYLTRSQETISGELHLQQSMIFRSGTQYYQMTSTITR